MKKLSIQASDEQIENLYKSLKVGTPISIALQYAKISASTYYYWVAIYSVALYCREQEELERLEDQAKSGVSLQYCKDMAAMDASARKMALGGYIEPTAESILRYKNNGRFRNFADRVYEIIAECNHIRSEVTMRHLGNIAKSTTDRRINASGSMWYLERTQADYFGRPVDKARVEETTPAPIEPISVEFVSSDNQESKERLNEMEKLVIKELKGGDDA